MPAPIAGSGSWARFRNRSIKRAPPTPARTTPTPARRGTEIVSVCIGALAWGHNWTALFQEQLSSATDEPTDSAGRRKDGEEAEDVAQLDVGKQTMNQTKLQQRVIRDGNDVRQ